MNRPENSDPLFPDAEAGDPLDSAGVLHTNGGRELKRGLRMAHATFVTFLIGSVAAMWLAYPRLADKPRVEALSDLERLGSEVDIATLKRQIGTAAEKELAFDLERVARSVALPELSAQRGLGPQPQLLRAEVPPLSTLAQLASMAQSGAKVPVLGPNPEALAASLRWRLAKEREPTPVMLTQLRVSYGVGLKAVDAEAVVEPARVEAQQASDAYDQSYARYTELRDRCDELIKGGWSKKDILPAVQDRVAAYELLVENKELMRRTSRNYAQAVARAQRRDALTPDATGGGSLMVVTLKPEGEAAEEYRIPMARATRFAFAPPFPVPPSLARLQSNPLWAEIKDLDAQAAIKAVNSQASFHLRSIDDAGRISGLLALHALPIVMLMLVWVLLRGCRAATRAYSPFGSTQGHNLPTPGTGSITVDRVLMLTLPLVVCSLVCVALWRAHELPLLAAALSVPSLALSHVTSRAWKELHRLLDAARNRSLVQPLPERAVGAPRLTQNG